MSDTVYTIALAGLLHDVGKFAERGEMELPPGYEQNNAGLYQRYNETQKRHTHRHALYTAAFLESAEKLLPSLPSIGDAKSGNSLINLAAMHHKPETPLQWIITMADRLSSGLDRQDFDKESTFVQYKDFRKTRVLPLAEKMFAGQSHSTREGYHFCYRLAQMTPESMFPVLRNVGEPATDDAAKSEYRDLFEGFTKALHSLEHRQLPSLWLEHFESLLLTFTTNIPAATVKRVIPDVSLFDHSKATAALATALYSYHAGTATLTESAVRDESSQKFMLVSGDFYGIQDFIFAEGGSSNRAAAKLLRGRSFAVSLLSELAADLLCKRLGVPITSIILNAAGKFTILASNLPQTVATVTMVEEEINDWLIKHFHGEVSMGFAMVPASPEEFKSRNFGDFWARLAEAGERKKFGKFDLERHGGTCASFLESFDSKLGICPFCGKRPAQADSHIKRLLPEADKSCRICRDHIYLGSGLIKGDRLYVFEDNAGSNLLTEPIFGIYQAGFDLTRELDEVERSGQLRKVWNIGGNVADQRVAARFLSGYVPLFQEADNHDDRLFGGKDEKKAIELREMIKVGGVKSFQHIASAADGIEALGILKADVDNLGKIFACGLPEDQLNLSRLATFSRQMNAYFALWLPHQFATDVRFGNIYTVFAGGDDLFLIGPWNRIIEFADYLHDSFAAYMCGNPEITISAGISVNKPGIPLPVLSSSSKFALKKAKDSGRDSISLFGETVKWADFAKLQLIRNQLADWQAAQVINKAMLYRLNELIDMAGTEQQLLNSKESFDLRDMECMKWRARLVYSVTRNVGKNLKGSEREKAVVGVKDALLDWLHTHHGALKIALWQILYEQR
jgi:CRISPR-associated protein Csm1